MQVFGQNDRVQAKSTPMPNEKKSKKVVIVLLPEGGRGISMMLQLRFSLKIMQDEVDYGRRC